MKKLCAVLAIIILFIIGCDNGTGGGGRGGTTTPTTSGTAPTLTDIKIVADVNQILSGPFLTTLNAGTQYVVLFFGSDPDLDITKIVIDYYKNGTFVFNENVPVVVGQTLVTEAFFGYLTPAEAGTWKGEAYLEDAKENKSGKKSITVTVN